MKTRERERNIRENEEKETRKTQMKQKREREKHEYIQQSLISCHCLTQNFDNSKLFTAFFDKMMNNIKAVRRICWK